MKAKEKQTPEAALTVAIGISGYAGVGKTVAANYIETRFGVERRHIAEPLRGMLRVLLKGNGISDDMVHRYLEGDLKDGVVIPEIGKTSRELQITLGTEWGRDLVNPNLWAETWARGVRDGDRVMNDSVRFKNEEAVIRALGGFTIRIDRPGSKPAKFLSRRGEWLFDRFGYMRGVHPSERIDLLDPDYIITNSGTLLDLYDDLDMICVEQGLMPVTARRAA